MSIMARPTAGRKIVHPVTAFLQTCWACFVYTACMAVMVYMLLVMGL